MTVPPLGTSGKVSVTTPGGSAVSPTDLFVGGSEIQATARTTLGGSATLAITTGGKIGLLLVDAARGQRLKVTATASTQGGCGLGNLGTTVSIIGPDGATIGAGSCVVVGSLIDSKPLTLDGTYSIVVDPYGSTTGSMTLAVSEATPDATATITPGGSAVTVTTTAATQNARVTFSGTAGQRVSLNVNATTYATGCLGGSNLLVSIRDPHGATLSAPLCTLAGTFLDVRDLPTTGTYTILVDPKGTLIGSITLQLYDVPADAAGTITPGGAAVGIATTVAGQNSSLTFSGVVNQRLSLTVTASTYAVCSALKNGPTAALTSEPTRGWGQ